MNENSNALFGIGHASEPRLQPLHDRCESVFLDQVEQALFGFEVVVEASERHAAFAREIAHGGAFVSLFTENFGGVGEDFRETPVIAGVVGSGLWIRGGIVWPKLP